MRLFLLIPFLLFTIIFFGCKKEKVADVHPEMVGYWTHFTSEISSKSLDIPNKGVGSIYYYHKGNPTEDNTAPWFIKKDKLLFGRVSPEEFTINTYPTTAVGAFISGYDTVSIGEKYMMLSGEVYQGQ